jgi:hypothetical protein
MKHIKLYESNVDKSPFIIGEYIVARLDNINKPIVFMKVISAAHDHIEINRKIKDSIFVQTKDLIHNFMSDMFYNTKYNFYFHASGSYKFEILFKGFSYDEAKYTYDINIEADKYNL